MDLKQCLILGSFCVVILAPISSSEHFELSSSSSVTGTVGQDVILPCQISLGRQPQSMEVQWQKIGDTPVNIYQFKATDDLETFGQGYQSRTAMAKEGLVNGNVSLKLKNMQVADEGTYRCIVTSTGWSSYNRTVLHVTGMGTVSIEILGPEGVGIKLACRSSGWFPHPELQWLMEDHQMEDRPFELEQDHEQLFSVLSFVTVLRGTSKVTCLVYEKGHLQMKQKSTIFLSRDIFPQIFPWIPAFWALFTLSFLGFGIAGYYLYKEKQKHRQKKNTEENQALTLETQVTTLKTDIQDLNTRLERAQSELDFRKAQSYLVPVQMDPSCKHPELVLSEDGKEVRHHRPSLEAATMPEALIVVGRVGFKEGRQYWQVRVGDKQEWEIGVLTETTRKELKKQKFDALQKEGCWSLRKSNGKYHPEEADGKIRGHSFEPQMFGVYLDWEEKSVSFYSISNTTAIWLTPIDTSEKLYPFFNPGHSEAGDEMKSLRIYPKRDWDLPSKLTQQHFSLISNNYEKANTTTANSQESKITMNLQVKKTKISSCSNQ